MTVPLAGGYLPIVRDGLCIAKLLFSLTQSMEQMTKAEFELIPRVGQCSFALREFHLPAFSSPWHFHPEYELTFIVQGRGRRFIGDHIARFGPGELVLLGANLPHFWHSDPATTDSFTEAHSVVIQFDPDCFGEKYLGQPELAEVKNLLHRAQRGIQFSGPVCESVGALMQRMLGTSGLERLIGFLTVLLRLEGATGSELTSRGFAPSLDDRAARRVNQIYQWVFARFAGPLDHDHIARRVGMSRSALCHYFKRVTGRTLTDFINEIRIGHARKLLIETDQTVSEIAYASGFESLSNFNRHFLDLTGVSPTEFRRRYPAESGLGNLPPVLAG